MATNWGQNDWMSKLADNTSLNMINLVGTYNSGDSTGGDSVNQQLNRGIRFFHLVLTSDGEWKNAVTSISSFLSQHKSEFAIVQIKHLLGTKAQAQDSRGQDWLTVFQNTFNNEQPDIRNLVYYTSNQPCYNIQLKSVRGKMILLADNDLQLGYAFDSPLTVDPNTFWPLNISTQITSLPGADPSSWGSSHGSNAPWNKVVDALNLALSRSSFSQIGITDVFANQSFYQLWLASEETTGNAAVATYFYEGIAQLLTHGKDADGPEQAGLKLNLGLVVVDNVNFDQDVISHIIQANPALKA